MKAMGDEEIAAINRERNAEHVRFRKKMTVHLRIILYSIATNLLLAINPFIL